jgi:hypothetical protein
LTLSELGAKIQEIAEATITWFEKGGQNLLDWNIGELTIGQAAFTLIIFLIGLRFLLIQFSEGVKASSLHRQPEQNTRDNVDLIQLALRSKGHFLTIHTLSSGYEVLQPSGDKIHLQNFRDLQEYYEQHK